MRFLDEINSGSKTTTSANALQAKQHSYHVLESSNVETVAKMLVRRMLLLQLDQHHEQHAHH